MAGLVPKMPGPIVAVPGVFPGKAMMGGCHTACECRTEKKAQGGAFLKADDYVFLAYGPRFASPE